MNERFSQQEMLEAVLTAYVEGVMTAEQAQWLNQVLLEDAEARRYYWQFMGLSADLKQAVAQLPSDEEIRERSARARGENPAGLRAMDAIVRVHEASGETPQLYGSVRGRMARMARKLFTARSLAAMLLLGIGVFALVYLLRPAPPPAPVAVATMLDSRNAVWEDERGRLIFFREGRQLMPQTLNLADGLARLKFSNGAVVILDGRNGTTRFELVSEAAGFLKLGQLTAQVESEQAKGFTVEVPGNRKVIDLGTEFGVTVDEAGRSEVHVLRGEVMLQKRNEAGDVTTVHLSKGEAVRTVEEASATFENIAFDDKPYETSLQQTQTDPPPRTEPRSYIAYQNVVGVKGTQDDFGGALGMDFVVTRPIRVTRLGAFDSGGDGFKRAITVSLWSRNDNATPSDPRDDTGVRIIASTTFTPQASGELVGTDRFLSVTDIVLQPGSYTIVASGYGEAEPNGNAETADLSRFTPTVNSGSGAIQFVGLCRWGEDAGAFPRTPDRGPVNRYSAGTFAFELIEENR